jgi:hypothetical protein
MTTEAELDALREAIAAGGRLRRTISEQLNVAQAKLDECTPYLKDGETPRERMDRDFADTQALTELLAQERERTAELKAKLAALSKTNDAPAPAGYRKLANGVRCRCVRLWQDGHGGYYCCRPDALSPPAPAPSGSGVRVKPLVWSDASDRLSGSLYYSLAKTPFGDCWVSRTVAQEWDASVGGNKLRDERGSVALYSSLDEAKAAAQADFEQRIRSCIASEKGGAV